MKPLIYSFSQEDLFNDLAESLKWLSTHVRLSTSRPTAYEKKLNYIVQQRASAGQFTKIREDNIEDYWNALFEAKELTEIHKGLALYRGEGLRNKLYKLIRGPEHFRDEKDAGASAESRNTGFELSIASRLLRAGSEIDLNSIADLVVFGDGYRLFIECKRPISYDTIGANVIEALKQLDIRFSTSKEESVKNLGLVAISIDKMANKKLGMHHAMDPESLAKKISHELDFALDLSLDIWKDYAHRKDLAILFSYSSPALVLERNSFTYCNLLTAGLPPLQLQDIEYAAWMETFSRLDPRSKM